MLKVLMNFSIGLGASEDFSLALGISWTLFVGLGVFMICLVRLRGLADEIRWSESIDGFFDWAEFIGGFFVDQKAFANLLLAWGFTNPLDGY